MVLNLSPELGARGITINAVAPGGTATDMADTHALSYKHPLLDTSMDAWAKTHGALGRLARPEEIAAVTAFLVSDDASYITGRPSDLGTTSMALRVATRQPHKHALDVAHAPPRPGTPRAVLLPVAVVLLIGTVFVSVYLAAFHAAPS